jgi:hypothetical protein
MQSRSEPALRRVGIVRHPSVGFSTVITEASAPLRRSCEPDPVTPRLRPMPQRASEPCLHDLRPGTTVCLHCRKAAREARIADRNRTLARITVVALAVGVAAAGVRAGLAAYRQGALPEVPQLMAATTKAIVESLPGTAAAATPGAPHADSAALRVDSAATRSDSTLAAPAATMTVPVAMTAGSPVTAVSGPMAAAPAPAPAVVTPSPAPAVVPPAPIVADGRTELEGGMYAIRSGDTVTVYFDTPEARTRRPEKFEQIVRATLPAIHGSTAESILGAVPPGALVGAADLLNDLPTRGVHLRSTDGRALSLWPETRAGRDGPLVISYRSVLAR